MREQTAAMRLLDDFINAACPSLAGPADKR